MWVLGELIHGPVSDDNGSGWTKVGKLSTVVVCMCSCIVSGWNMCERGDKHLQVRGKN